MPIRARVRVYDEDLVIGRSLLSSPKGFCSVRVRYACPIPPLTIQVVVIFAERILQCIVRGGVYGMHVIFAERILQC